MGEYGLWTNAEGSSLEELFASLINQFLGFLREDYLNEAMKGLGFTNSTVHDGGIR
jgi:hypothetical protein